MHLYRFMLFALLLAVVAPNLTPSFAQDDETQVITTTTTIDQPLRATVPADYIIDIEINQLYFGVDSDAMVSVRDGAEITDVLSGSGTIVFLEPADIESLIELDGADPAMSLMDFFLPAVREVETSETSVPKGFRVDGFSSGVLVRAVLPTTTLRIYSLANDDGVVFATLFGIPDQVADDIVTSIVLGPVADPAVTTVAYTFLPNAGRTLDGDLITVEFDVPEGWVSASYDGDSSFYYADSEALVELMPNLGSDPDNDPRIEGQGGQVFLFGATSLQGSELEGLDATELLELLVSNENAAYRSGNVMTIEVAGFESAAVADYAIGLNNGLIYVLQNEYGILLFGFFDNSGDNVVMEQVILPSIVLRPAE